MSAFRFVVATAAGFVLFQYVVVFLGGFLAAIHVPKAYFSFFGRENLEVAHALLNFGLHALPTALLVAAGMLSLHRLLPSRRPQTWLPMLLGMLSCLLLWVLFLSPAYLESTGLPRPSWYQAIQSFFAIPWWGISSAAAPWLGAALAAWLITRNERRRRPSVA
jgi:uncharacterized BrkB/YihY/UPF0761 family membrane protein